jgi:hypothetical protein
MSLFRAAQVLRWRSHELRRSEPKTGSGSWSEGETELQREPTRAEEHHDQIKAVRPSFQARSCRYQ